MPRFAVVKAGVVENVVLADPEVAQEKGYIEAGAAAPGWSWDGAEFTPPPPPPDTTPFEQKLAARRYDAEIGGAVWNGWPVTTDRASQAMVGNAYKLAQDGHWADGNVWKFADGVPRGLTAQQVMEMALAVAAHVQACFEVEAQKLADHEAGNTVDVDTGWPA